MLENLTLDVFTNHLNTTFRFQYEKATQEFELIEAKDMGSTPKLKQFSILFRGPSEPIFNQGMCPFEHDELGAVPLFIVPVGQDEEGVYYEVVFSRLV